MYCSSAMKKKEEWIEPFRVCACVCDFFFLILIKANDMFNIFQKKVWNMNYNSRNK